MIPSSSHLKQCTRDNITIPNHLQHQCACTQQHYSSTADQATGPQALQANWEPHCGQPLCKLYWRTASQATIVARDPPLSSPSPSTTSWAPSHATCGVHCTTEVHRASLCKCTHYSVCPQMHSHVNSSQAQQPALASIWPPVPSKPPQPELIAVQQPLLVRLLVV